MNLTNSVQSSLKSHPLWVTLCVCLECVQGGGALPVYPSYLKLKQKLEIEKTEIEIYWQQVISLELIVIGSTIFVAPRSNSTTFQWLKLVAHG